MASTPIHRAPRKMSRTTSFLLTLASWGLPALLAGGIGAGIGSGWDVALGAAIAFVLVWSGVFWALGVRKISERRFVLVERLGKFHSVKCSGLRWLHPWFDRAEPEETFEAVNLSLFKDGGQIADLIDFQDISTKVKITYVGTIADPEQIARENWRTVDKQVAFFTYNNTDPWKRIDTIVDSAVRPLLEGYRSDLAKTDKLQIANDAAKSIRDILIQEVGFYLAYDKAIVIEDIALTPAQVALRDLQLEGEQRALETAARVQGPVNGIAAVVKAAQDHQQQMTWDQGTELVFRQLSLEAMTKIPNVTFVAGGVNDVVRTLDVGNSGR